LIGGTPTSPATAATVVITVTDSNNATATVNYTLTVNGPLSITSPSPLTAVATIGASYSQTLTNSPVPIPATTGRPPRSRRD
jgi:di/tricarboxylate transporter